MTRLAVFMDRDGVINRPVIRGGRPHPPASLEDLEILPGVAEALAELKDAGYWLVIVTNQPDVARGSTPKAFVDSMNDWLKAKLPLDDILTCFHDDADQCDCRKPKPGLLQAASRRLDIDLKGSYMVGDRWRDIEAGRLAGCTTFFIDWDYAERQPASYDFRVGSLSEAARIILGNGSR